MAINELNSYDPRAHNAGGFLRNLTLAAVLSTFALVILGGVVRVTYSGLGCPDWPLCHGQLFPPWQLNAMIEFSHRLVASAVVGPLVLATAVSVWFGHRQERCLLYSTSLAVVLLILQGLLGGMTVLNELSPELVAAHLALGQALLACLVVVAIVANYGPLTLPSYTNVNGVIDRFPVMAMIAAIGVYLLLLTGSYVTATGASAACSSDWPLCQGGLLPVSRLPMIHMLHRVAAVLIGTLLMYFLHFGIRGNHRPGEIRLLSMVTAALFIVQVMVGAFTVWLKFPEALIAFHLAMATAVWGAMVAIAAMSLVRKPVSTGYLMHA
jgi:heme A synthase